MGKITRFGVFCLITSIGALLLASIRDVTAPALGLPVLASGLILAVGTLVDRRTRAASPVDPVNWAEEFTARVRRERAAARSAAGIPFTD